MKRIVYLLSFAAAVMLAASCDQRQGPVETEVFHWADSTAHAYMTMDVEYPKGSGAAADRMREELSGVVDRILSHVTSYEDERFFPPYDGEAGDTKAMLEYYRDNAFAQIAGQSQQDADEREAYILSDEDFSDEQKAEMIADMPRWGYEFGLRKLDETDKYVVFQSMDYIYMGGAHGGVTGEGCLTFSKQDGQRIKDFVDPSCAADIQPLLVRGVKEYFSDNGYEVSEDELLDMLFIDDRFIPLPSWPLYPSGDGLAFVYQQYEIASYADGMPSFTIPYADIEPYMTPEAKALLIEE